LAKGDYEEIRGGNDEHIIQGVKKFLGSIFFLCEGFRRR
jgi:hypothetical protein